MKTLNDLLAQCGSYFRSLCRITEFNNDGHSMALLTLPADCQVSFYQLNGKIGMSPLITSNGGNEEAKFWLTFEEATIILKAYAQAWERSNPQGVWEEEYSTYSGTRGTNILKYAGFIIKFYLHKKGVIVLSMFQSHRIGYVGPCIETIHTNIEIVGGEHEARSVLFDHLQSLKGGGK